jgi:hypothetical protein
MFADVLIAHLMIEIILISRHAAEDFHLNQKAFSARLPRKTAELRKSCANRPLYRSQTKRRKVRSPARPRNASRRANRQTDKAAPAGGANRADRYCAFCNSGRARSRRWLSM